MVMVGYCFGIRWERRLCEEVHTNFAHPGWFCRLGLDGAVPMTPPSRRTGTACPRKRSAAASVRDGPSGAASARGWSAARGFAVDASLIKADTDRQNGIEGEQGLPPGATGRAARGVSGGARRCRLRCRDRGHARSSSHQQIQRRAGRAPTAGRLSSPIRPTIRSMSRTRSSWMSKRPRLFGKQKSSPPSA